MEYPCKSSFSSERSRSRRSQEKWKITEGSKVGAKLNINMHTGTHEPKIFFSGKERALLTRLFLDTKISDTHRSLT
jgi:hypothetical protein